MRNADFCGFISAGFSRPTGIVTWRNIAITPTTLLGRGDVVGENACKNSWRVAARWEAIVSFLQGVAEPSGFKDRQ